MDPDKKLELYKSRAYVFCQAPPTTWRVEKDVSINADTRAFRVCFMILFQVFDRPTRRHHDYMSLSLFLALFLSFKSPCSLVQPDVYAYVGACLCARARA